MSPSKDGWSTRAMNRTLLLFANKFMINGGYYIKARKIQQSEIGHAPPHVREIWDWLLMEANHTDGISSGRKIERGQLVRSYRDIQEGLHWMVGWRKQTYSKNDCETAMRWLTKRNMVHTQKTTRGMIINIVNYSLYQDPSNYETDKETYKKHTRNIQTTDTINKNDKKNKNVKNNPKGLQTKSETYGNPDVNSFLETFKKEFDLNVLDGSAAENRKFAWLIIKKCNSLEVAINVIRAGASDSFYGNKIASVKKLYYHMVEIVQKARSKKTNITEI